MKLVRYLIVLTIFISSVSFALPAADLAALLNGVQTMRANFTQSVFDNRGKKIQQSQGQMAMQRPGKFRWDIKKPSPQIIVANESKLWVYDPDLEQVTVRTLKHAAGETPAMLLSHVNTVLDKDFAIKEGKSTTPGWRWFILVPKSKDNMLSSIQLGFDNKQIRQMKFADHLGHTTVIQFEHIDMNVSLNAALFHFKPPANADVINETQQK